MKILVTGKELFDGEKRIRNFALSIENNKITECSTANEINHKKYTQVIDLHDSYVTPGFIDAHVHLYLDPSKPLHSLNFDTPIQIARETARAVSNAECLLSRGITTCRCVGTPHSMDIALRDAISEGRIQGPHIVSSGAALCVTGGHAQPLCIECDGSEQFRAGVRHLIKQGVDCIKVMATGGINSPGPEPSPPELTEDEIISVIETAHNHGLKVAAHAHGKSGIKRCVKNGIDSIEHGVFLTEDIIEIMKEKGTFLVPTLCAPHFAVQEGLKREPHNPGHKSSAKIIRKHSNAILRAHQRGVPIAMGSDAGTPCNRYENATYELVLLSKIGLDAEEILTIATRNSARLLGLENRKGSLKPGFDADFLVFETAPWQDIKAVANIKKVFTGGIPCN